MRGRKVSGVRSQLGKSLRWVLVSIAPPGASDLRTWREGGKFSRKQQWGRRADSQWWTEDGQTAVGWRGAWRYLKAEGHGSQPLGTTEVER